MSAATELCDRIMRSSAFNGLEENSFYTPLAALTLRFSGAGLAHVGKAVTQALELAMTCTTRPLTYRGHLFTGKRKVSYTSPQETRGAGWSLLRNSLAAQHEMPVEGTQIFLKDADPESFNPEELGIYFSLADDPKRSWSPAKGFFTVGRPMATLAELPPWLELADRLVEILHAEVAWLSPSVWLVPWTLRPGGRNHIANDIELFGRDPQLDAPSLYAYRSPFITFGEGRIRPDPFSGFLAPAWIMWANAALAKRVTRFAGIRTKLLAGGERFQLGESTPFAMNDALYAQWQRGWVDLKPLHLSCSIKDETKYFLTRFDAPTYARLEPDWQKENDEKKRKSDLLYAVAKLAAQPRPEILALAEKTKGKVDPSQLWHRMVQALVTLLIEKKIEQAEVEPWLAFGKAHTAPGGDRIHTAGLFAACGDLEQALALLESSFFDSEGKWIGDDNLRATLKYDGGLKLLARNAQLRALKKRIEAAT